MLIWYLARGAGLAAFAALSVATAVGAAGARRTGDPATRVVRQYVHRAAALSGVALVVLHVTTLLADPYAHVGKRGLVPLGSGYRPVAVTFGVLALYLFTAVAITGALRARLSGSGRAVRLWRAVHLSAYLAWAMSAWHFLTAGTDAATAWARVLLVVGAAVVIGGVGRRLSERGRLTRRRAAPVALAPATSRPSPIAPSVHPS